MGFVPPCLCLVLVMNIDPGFYSRVIRDGSIDSTILVATHDLSRGQAQTCNYVF